LGRFPYETAIAIWWSIQIALFICAGWILWNALKPLPGWRLTAALGMAAFYPIYITITYGYLTPLLFFVWAMGMELYRHRQSFLAGCVLSLMAMKPQLFVGIMVWLLLRNDIRTLVGICLAPYVRIVVVFFEIDNWGRNGHNYATLS
jgi:hypothetical protein